MTRSCEHLGHSMHIDFRRVFGVGMWGMRRSLGLLVSGPFFLSFTDFIIVSCGFVLVFLTHYIVFFSHPLLLTSNQAFQRARFNPFGSRRQIKRGCFAGMSFR